MNHRQQDEEKARAEFEQWAAPRGYSMERTTDSYKSQGTKSAWRGWWAHARFAAPVEQPGTAGAAKGGADIGKSDNSAAPVAPAGAQNAERVQTGPASISETKQKPAKEKLHPVEKFAANRWRNP